jgi:hypothetical protein
LISYWLCTNRRQTVPFFGRIVSVMTRRGPVRCGKSRPVESSAAGRGADMTGRSQVIPWGKQDHENKMPGMWIHILSLDWVEVQNP